MKKSSFMFLPVLLLALAVVSGCGYTTKSRLPESVKSVHVMPVQNAIDLSAEISDKNPFRVYRPGIEVDITNAIINRFVFDGHLKVLSPGGADAVVEAKLIDYRRDALRYSEGDDIQEYRLSIVLDVRLYETANPGKNLWSELVVGDTTFFLSGSRALSEDEAASKAVEDLARRVVEKTIELW